MQQEYISIKKLAIKYDLHPDTIRTKATIQGYHYVKIGKLIRYHVERMHTLLTNEINPTSISLDNFLIDTVE